MFVISLCSSYITTSLYKSNIISVFILYSSCVWTHYMYIFIVNLLKTVTINTFICNFKELIPENVHNALLVSGNFTSLDLNNFQILSCLKLICVFNIFYWDMYLYNFTLKLSCLLFHNDLNYYTFICLFIHTHALEWHIDEQPTPGEGNVDGMWDTCRHDYAGVSVLFMPTFSGTLTVLTSDGVTS